MHWAWAGLAFLSMALSQAQASTTPLYAVFDTDATPPQLQVVEPSGEMVATGECNGASPASDPLWVLPFRAGPVEYDFLENGTPRFHPEAGLGMDIHVTAATLHWFLEVSPTHDQFPVRVSAEVREGSEGDRADLDAGNLVARGETSEMLLPTGLHEIVLPLEVQGEGKVGKQEGFTLRVALHDALDCAMPTFRLQAVSQDGHRSRLEVATREGVHIDYVHPEVAAGVIVVHTASNTPFGNADLDIGNLTFTIDGPSTPKHMQETVAQDAHGHDRHGKPVEATWMWRYQEEGAADGTYTVSMTVWNRAHTASDTEVATFTLEGGECYGCGPHLNDVVEPPAKGAGDASVWFLPLALVAAWLCLPGRRTR